MFYKIKKLAYDLNIGGDSFYNCFVWCPCEPILKKIESESHRYYHTLDHVYDVFSKAADTFRDSPRNTIRAFLFAVFHDAVYIPTSKTNEIDSNILFRSTMEEIDRKLVSQEDIEHVSNNILNSAHFNNKLMDYPYLLIDRAPLYDAIFGYDTVDYFTKIAKEFQFYDFEEIVAGNIEVAKKVYHWCFEDKRSDEEIDHIIKTRYLPLINTVKPRVAIYCGSFNPLHIGHMHIIEEAEKSFDKVIIAQGLNPDKTSDVKSEIVKIQSDKYGYREFVQYGNIFDLYNHYSKKYNVTFIKGFRGETDVAYDMQQVRVIKAINPAINFTFIPCDVKYMHISSSTIRNLIRLGLVDEARKLTI